jgi:hypothetical protein
MLKAKKPIKITQSREKLSNRIGLPLVEQIIEKLELRRAIDEIFPKPGSNRGIKASDYVTTLMYMFIDGAMHLEDVNHLHSDEAYQEMIKEMRLPGSDAIGDWLRRYGSKESERWMWEIMERVLGSVGKEGKILDIDATIIESDKGDSKKTYKGIKGYQPMLGIISENGMIVSSDFRQGNVSPQSGLVEFLENCRKHYPQEIRVIRSDSAGWQKNVVDYCDRESMGYTITANQTSDILKVVEEIPEDKWRKGIDRDGIPGGYEVGETGYYFGSKKRKLRLVVKREVIKSQYDLFASYKYWIIGTNLPEDQYDRQRVIHLHQGRGSMEKRIGELKHQLNVNHLPCGQFNANCLYFTIGLLAYNILQLLKIAGLPEEYHNKTVKTLRYQLLKLAGKVVMHARYMIVQISAPLKNIELFTDAYYRLRYAPLPS